jgi:hypothetical protein
MAICLSTGLSVKNTFLDGEPEELAGMPLIRSKSCIARFSEWSVSEESSEGSTDTDDLGYCTDTDDGDSDEWGDADYDEDGVNNRDRQAFDASTSHTLTMSVSAPIDASLVYNDYLCFAGDQSHLGMIVFGALPVPGESALQVCENVMEPSSLPSMGSQYHGSLMADGQPACRPCAWQHKTSGCANGTACQYCHLCPPEELKNRKKEKLARLKSQ